MCHRQRGSSSQLSQPKCCQQMHNAGADGWVERGGGCCLFTLRALPSLWLVTPVMLRGGLTEEDNSDILLGKSRVVPLGTASLPENSSMVFLNLTSLQRARTMPGFCLTCLIWGFFLRKKVSRMLSSCWTYQTISGILSNVFLF